MYIKLTFKFNELILNLRMDTKDISLVMYLIKDEQILELIMFQKMWIATKEKNQQSLDY